MRLHGCDPDAAEAAARRLGFKVLVETTDKPHGLREAYLVDADGYVWVDQTKIYRQELGDWVLPESFLALT